MYTHTQRHCTGMMAHTVHTACTTELSVFFVFSRNVWSVLMEESQICIRDQQGEVEGMTLSNLATTVISHAHPGKKVWYAANESQ